jgi:hypothetical protein
MIFFLFFSLELVKDAGCWIKNASMMNPVLSIQNRESSIILKILMISPSHQMTTNNRQRTTDYSSLTTNYSPTPVLYTISNTAPAA